MKSKIALLFLIAFTFKSSFTLAWGGRGHASLCEAAVFLVKNDHLRSFLKARPHMMAHLCNIPDISWKDLPEKQTEVGNPTHYFDPEALGAPVVMKSISLDFMENVHKLTAEPNPDIMENLGSNWWRADQFYRLAVAAGKKAKDEPTPKNKKEEQNNDLPFNAHVYEMLVSMGLMGHFVGDNSQPFHVTSDYDGYAALHGGIHWYYEDACVDQFPADLIDRIFKKAQKLKNISFIKAKTPLEKMRLLADLSYADIKTVLKLDPVNGQSNLKIENGKKVKTPAPRKPAEIGYKSFEPLLTEHLARGALLLANMWDQIYAEAGAPNLANYKSYRYPLNPEFIPPDYIKAGPVTK